jgi:hypothetical protein
MSKDRRSDSQLIEAIRNLMSDKNRSPFFYLEEIAEGIGYQKEKHILLPPYNRLDNLISQMQCQHVITTGGTIAPNAYVLQERMDKYLKAHEGQVL